MKTLKILIVDDNPRFIEALRYLLEENFSGHIEKIDSLLDGSDVLELIKSEKFNYTGFLENEKDKVIFQRWESDVYSVFDDFRNAE